METLSKQSGFSLVELLVASAIFFSFMVGVMGLYSRGHRTFSRGQSKIEAQQSARVAMDTIARELRMAGYDPSSAADSQSTDSALQIADQDALGFLADVDGDGSTELVTFRLDGDRLMRDVSTWDGSTFSSIVFGQLAPGVIDLKFDYFDGAAPPGTPLLTPVSGADLNDIRRVLVRIEAADTTRGSTETFALTMDVTLRNL